MEKLGHQTWIQWLLKRIQRYEGDCAADDTDDGLAKAEAAAKIRKALTEGYAAASDAALYFIEYPDGTKEWLVRIAPELIADG